MNPKVYVRSCAIGALAACIITGCATRDIDGAGVSLEALGVQDDASYADAVPRGFQTQIRPDTAQHERPVAVIDASNDQSFFPIPRRVRSFASRAALIQFVVDTFGANGTRDSNSGELTSFEISFAQHGTPIFEDGRLGVRYRVVDPLLAFLGGRTGNVVVADETWCLDPDGQCDDGHASYLEPQGVLTAPSHVDVCGTSSVCVQFHSFYNTTNPFPFPYARHGSNVKFTNSSPLPGTQLRTSAVIFSDHWGNIALPTVENQGQSAVETSSTCAASFTCPEYMATVVCGEGRIVDPDLNATRRTGNGSGASFCPE